MSQGSAFKQAIAKWMFRPLVIVGQCLRNLRMRCHLACAHQYGSAYALLPDRLIGKQPGSKIVAVITHVCRPDESDHAKTGTASCERLLSTIESLLGSFSHHDIHLIVNTYRDWHQTAQLPEPIKQRLEIIQHEEIDPMHVGFEVPDIFARHREEADWFIHLEDDILVQDATFLDKLTFFNQSTNQPKSLLLPNRFESMAGRKYYIDLRWPHGDFRPEAWAALATFQAGGVSFGQCANSHSACYFLNRLQLDLWLDSPRDWHNKITGAGPQESWSSCMLNEVFDLYKPHPSNLHYLEVRHCHPTYFQRLLAYEQEKKIRIQSHTAS